MIILFNYIKRKKIIFFFPKSLSDIQNIDLDVIDDYLKIFNLSLKKICSVYLGKKTNNLPSFNNFFLIDEINILEIIVHISKLYENNKLTLSDQKILFEENFQPLYGKLPSTN